MSKNLHARLGWFFRDSLQSADTFARKRTHFLGKFRRRSGGGIILLSSQAQHARRFRSPVATRKWRPKRQRHFTKYRAWHAPTKRTRDTVEQFDHFDLSGNYGVERSFVTLVYGPVAGCKSNVGGGVRDTLKISRGDHGKYGDGPHFVKSKHGLPRSRRVSLSRALVRQRALYRRRRPSLPVAERGGASRRRREPRG